jgi:hypothetical protein
MVYDDTPYAHGLAQAFKAAFEQSGGAVTDFLMRNVGMGNADERSNAGPLASKPAGHFRFHIEKAGV